jgi:hypothetical protein
MYQFWWDMYEICTNTPLGIPVNVNGQEITVEVSPGPTIETISESSRYQFWWDMYEICTNRPLGISANANGQEITVEVSPGPTSRLYRN